MGSHNSKALTRDGLSKLMESSNAVQIISEEHKKLMSIKVEGTLAASRTTAHLENTQNDAPELCFDHSRVVLSEETGTNNYQLTFPINATYIEGFNHPKAYITTKTPDSETTICNFWKMIWEHRTKIIVTFQESEESVDGISYWNPEEGSSLQFGKLRIETYKIIESHPSFQIANLLITDENGATLFVNQLLFTKWQQVNISPPQSYFIELLLMVQLYNQSPVEAVSQEGYNSPIVVHCSDGLQRSMVFCATDIALSSISETGEVNLYSIVSKLRKDKYNCLYSVNDYCFCYIAVYYYITFYKTA
uniref:Protein tyrosine phosphatase n=1 Tax=Glyptapanteles indiensis TaxID=92994 RepID=B7S980_GLYIN|nr:protein tyrosine phosphatase [Glyptapanteles indiensis]